MDDNSQTKAAARWFEDASSQLAAQILARLEAMSKSDYALLPRLLVVALQRSALEKVEAALGGVAGLGCQTEACVGEAPPRDTAQHGSLLQSQSSQNVRSNEAKQARPATTATKNPGRKGRVAGRQDAPGQMDLVEFLAEQTPE